MLSQNIEIVSHRQITVMSLRPMYRQAERLDPQVWNDVIVGYILEQGHQLRTVLAFNFLFAI